MGPTAADGTLINSAQGVEWRNEFCFKSNPEKERQKGTVDGEKHTRIDKVAENAEQALG